MSLGESRRQKVMDMLRKTVQDPYTVATGKARSL